MGGEIEIFPEWLLDPKRQRDAEIFLNNLLKAGTPPRRIKEALSAWCQAVGVTLTREKVEKVFEEFEIP